MLQQALLIILLSLVLTSVVPNHGYDEVDDKKLPTIWQSIGENGFYHLMFQLQVLQTPERITVEEWASFDKQLFRLDLIRQEKRITYLSFGKTNEIFRYSPFSCNQAKQDSEELGIIGYLFKAHKLNEQTDTTAVAYGLGPLWLQAKAEAVTDKLVTKNSRGYKKHQFIEDYICYQMTFKWSDSEVPYKLKFFFEDKSSFVDAVEWSTDVKDEKQSNTLARAKLIQFDQIPISNSVFDLPIGYGCKRKPEVDHNLDIPIGLELLHKGAPNQAVLDVSISKPKDKTLRRWENSKYTLQMMRGSLKMNHQSHSYFVTLTKYRDSKTSRLRRIKSVWSALETSEQAVVYTIDEDSGECEVSHQSFNDNIKLTFPVQKADWTPMALSMDLIAAWYSDHSDYHMIKEGVGLIGDGYMSNETFYEKRIEKFELKTDGKVVWSGPISIVKKIDSFGPFVSDIELNKDIRQSSALDSYHTSMTIFFLSSSYSEVEYKIAIKILDINGVDVNFMLRQMDIGSCFTIEQKEDIVIKYPLESRELSKNLYAIKDIVEEIFCVNLFGSTPILPIQITNLEVTFDNFFMYLKMTLLDLPLTQIFELKPDKKLVSGPSQLIEKIASTVDKCATSCDYYSCFRFSYDPTSLRCSLEVHKNTSKVEIRLQSELYESVDIEINSTWSRHNPKDGGRFHLRPQTIVDLLNKFVLYGKEEEEDKDEKENESQVKVPLTFRIQSDFLAYSKNGSPWIELKPVSLHSDMDSMNEFVKEERRHPNGTSSTIIKVEGAHHLHVQYSVLIEGRELKHEGRSIEGLSYEDCELQCENSDCRSFSYCASSRECYTSNLHKMTDIQPNLRFQPKCSVFILDYLTKFESFGPAVTPTTASKILVNMNNRDCATACIEEQDFNCQGFYHCREVKENWNCLLQDKHIEEARSTSELDIYSSNLIGNNSTRDRRECNFYSRSYLAQFDAFYEKAIEYPEIVDPKKVFDTIDSTGAEDCAQNCILQSCLAFHICIDSGLRQVCNLAKRSVRKSHLVSRKWCTTFVLSDKSQFNLQYTNLVNEFDKPDRVALDKSINSSSITVIDLEAFEASKKDLNAGVFELFSGLHHRVKLIDGSHWLSKLLSMLFGIILGVGCVVIWRQRDEIYNRATSLSDSLRRRI